MKKLTKFFLAMLPIIIICILVLSPQKTFSQNYGQVWTNTPETFIVKGERRILPSKYSVLKSNLYELKNQLNNAPFELSDRARFNPYIIEIPMPSGEFSKFILTEYSMMEPGLASQFPEMKTYTIKGIDDPYAVGKLDITALGFHAMVLTPMGDYFIDPYSSDEREIYISYYKSDLTPDGLFKCEVTEQLNNDFINNNNEIMTGQNLRTYRLACAATGEYTAFFGGTVALGQASIVTAINRVNGVYERDMSVRMTLVANNTNIVYTNSATDPYTNTNGSAMLGQNQTTLDNVSLIGSGNYDIGHVFSTGGGGVAGLKVVCVNGQKAKGVTGLPSPTGDPFYIDYVAHEMGHQFGGNHTFNSSSSNCGGGNRNASTAWEPGSGSTIMAYAGICTPEDLQSNSDAYFHSGSVGEITSYTQTGNGNSCSVSTATGNTPPTVTVPSGGFTIPISTPFQLTGSATDVENPGSLTYCWEEFEVGPAVPIGSPTGTAPIFRSFNPVTTSSRFFPKLSNIINNTQTIGELLPTYTRALQFRMTVRDNNAGGGGINWGTVSFSVNSGAGPFVVTSPNTFVDWSNSVPQTVTWNVANTTASPVSCSLVNIKLSTDGGNTFPITLSSNTPNDGSESVTLPILTTTLARIKVEASGNIFFDMSNTNFTISGPLAVPSTFTLIPQGFYNTVTNSLNMRDTVTIILRSTISPYNIVDMGKTVIDSLTFSGSLTFASAPTGTYYVVVKRRSDLETWSKDGGESYIQGTPFSYDFTSAQTQAYGSNLVLVGSKYCDYTGDVDNSYVIELLDIISVFNESSLFVSGYVYTDLNGDRLVNLNDVILVFNNSANFVIRKAPPGASPEPSQFNEVSRNQQKGNVERNEKVIKP